MPRDNARSQHTRVLIAQRAALLMAEHGIRDYALAKRKAARQLGLATQHGLPSNDEVDDALAAYQDLFAPEDARLDLTAVRGQALEVMRLLERFQPWLTGGVAQGTVTRHAEIEIEVYGDSSKELEQYLLNLDIEFKTEERRDGSYFTLFGDPANVSLRMLPLQSQHTGPRSGDTRRRLNAEQLHLLLQAEAGQNMARPLPE